MLRTRFSEERDQNYTNRQYVTNITDLADTSVFNDL